MSQTSVWGPLYLISDVEKGIGSEVARSADNKKIIYGSLCLRRQWRISEAPNIEGCIGRRTSYAILCWQLQSNAHCKELF